jgi:methylated-DNA-protein-cysteine methyltransferase-like protein
MRGRGAGKPDRRTRRRAAGKPDYRALPRGTAGSDDSVGVHESIRRIVMLVPRGRVATYGQIAAIEGRCTPRMVGYAMSSVPEESGVPWHRVINSRGTISLSPGSDGYALQRAMLESEGVVFDDRGRVDLSRFGWQGPGARRR